MTWVTCSNKWKPCTVKNGRGVQWNDLLTSLKCELPKNMGFSIFFCIVEFHISHSVWYLLVLYKYLISNNEWINIMSPCLLLGMPNTFEKVSSDVSLLDIHIAIPGICFIFDYIFLFSKSCVCVCVCVCIVLAFYPFCAEFIVMYTHACKHYRWGLTESEDPIHSCRIPSYSSFPGQPQWSHHN
jgi:hypothetical protein